MYNEQSQSFLVFYVDLHHKNKCFMKNKLCSQREYKTRELMDYIVQNISIVIATTVLEC